MNTVDDADVDGVGVVVDILIVVLGLSDSGVYHNTFHGETRIKNTGPTNGFLINCLGVIKNIYPQRWSHLYSSWNTRPSWP